MQVIEGIAFQTNLLALNAAIQAEGAGPGRGLDAIVHEAGALARQCAEAADGISGLIAESRPGCGGLEVGELAAALQSLAEIADRLHEIVEQRRPAQPEAGPPPPPGAEGPAERAVVKLNAHIGRSSRFRA